VLGDIDYQPEIGIDQKIECTLVPFPYSGGEGFLLLGPEKRDPGDAVDVVLEDLVPQCHHYTDCLGIIRVSRVYTPLGDRMPWRCLMTGMGHCKICGKPVYRDSHWVQDKEGLWCTPCYSQGRGLQTPEGEIDYSKAAALLLQGGTLEEIEQILIRTAIDLEKGNMTRAARRLGIGRATIYRKVPSPEEKS
jgi:hypothetical protein